MPAMVKVWTKRCWQCGRDGALELPAEGVSAWQAGTLVQDAFPGVSAGVREQLVSGVHPGCWEALFGA